MRTFDADAAIERGKKLHNFKQDQQLAEFLGVSRTSLASWKRRNSIPAKYLIQMTFGTARTVDWLVSGEEKETEDEYGFTREKPFVDPYILWLAVKALVIELEMGPDKHKELAELIDDETLSYVHIYVGEFITKLMASKEKWAKSGLVKDKDVYKAVATEFGLAQFELPPVPWWEDERIV